MTNKEAIDALSRVKTNCDPDGLLCQALSKAISALQQPFEDVRWRDAEWPRDAASPPKDARFRYKDIDGWNYEMLVGYYDETWIDSNGREYHQCQVIDE